MSCFKSMTILVGIFFLTMACTHVTDNAENQLNVSIIDSGQYSNHPQEGMLEKVIKSDAEFRSTWQDIHTGTSPKPSMPDIDFEEQMVILVMLESKPSGGFNIDEFEVQRDSTGLLVEYAEVQPGSDCMTTQAISRPYRLVSIPKTSENIHFEKGEPIIKPCE